MDQVEYCIDGKPVHRDQFVEAIARDGDEDLEYLVDDKPVSREEFAALVREIHRRSEPFFEVLDSRGSFLEGRAANVTSQFGEDGLIAATLERIGVQNAWCFEVGAGDGIYLSNTWSLRNGGWSALLIEADEVRFNKLAFQAVPDQVRCLHYRIGPDSLDHFLDAVGAPTSLDVGVIDIDGQDYHAFAGLRRHRPRVLLVEYNQLDAPPPPLGGPGQAGLTAILELGRSRQYVPLARTNVNVLFAAAEHLV